MEITKLKTFVDLAQSLSFSKTAENLYTTQSTVSKHIKALEDEFGVILFERNNKQVKLSEYGKVVFPFALKLIQTNGQLEQTLENYLHSKDNQIVLGTIPTFTSYYAFESISQYLRANPQVKIQIVETETNKLMEQLKEDKYDLAFVRTFNDQGQFDEIITEDDEFVVCINKNHPLAKQQQIELIQLAKENFILLGEATLLYFPVIEMCQQVGFTPNIIYQGGRVSVILDMLKSNLGIAILMKKSIQKLDLTGIRLVDLVQTQKSRLVFARAKKKHTPLQNELWIYLKKIFNSDLE